MSSPFQPPNIRMIVSRFLALSAEPIISPPVVHHLGQMLVGVFDSLMPNQHMSTAQCQAHDVTRPSILTNLKNPTKPAPDVPSAPHCLYSSRSVPSALSTQSTDVPRLGCSPLLSRISHTHHQPSMVATTELCDWLRNSTA